MSQSSQAVTAAPIASAAASPPRMRCVAVVSAALREAASAWSSARSSSRSAQANSSASMARPIGMTTNAGPGVTSIARPTSVTVAPASAKPIRYMRLRRSCALRRSASRSFMRWAREGSPRLSSVAPGTSPRAPAAVSSAPLKSLPRDEVADLDERSRAGLGVVPVAREPAAGGHDPARLPRRQHPVRIDRPLVARVDLEVHVRRRRLGVARVADEAQQRARLDLAAAHRLRRERGQVRVEERVAALGLEPEPVAADRQRADAIQPPVRDGEHRAAERGEDVVALVGADLARGAEVVGDTRLAVDREDEAPAREALRRRDLRL